MTQFFFDSSRHVLVDNYGETINLRPQSLKVLLLLLENANQVVTKESILKSVWRDIEVTDDSVTQCIVDIRRVLGKEHRPLLQTVPKVGYRLCLGADEDGLPIIAQLGVDEIKGISGPPTAQRPHADKYGTKKLKDPRSDIGTGRLLLLTSVISFIAIIFAFSSTSRWTNDDEAKKFSFIRGPTLAVLPFTNAGKLADDDYFNDGITEDIIALLSRFSDLGLVSWSAVSNRDVADQNIKSIADKFGVRYLISGSVRRDNERVRVAVRLTDVRNGRLLWSERYDEPLQDVFLVQDKISKQIVATLAVKLTRIETSLSQHIPTKNIAAYQLSLLGRRELSRRTREGNLVARERFLAAIALDPNYADAYIRLGETYLAEAVFGWTEWPDQSIDKAKGLGRKALEIGGTNARSLGFMALAHIRTAEYEKAQTYLDRALSFNANDPSLHEIQGLVHLWNGRAQAAIDHLIYVLKYDPDSTAASSNLGAAYYIVGKPSDAVASIERLNESAPHALFAHIILTAALVEFGDIDSAKAAAAVVRRQHPFLTANGVSKMEIFATDEVRERFITSLRSAGID